MNREELESKWENFFGDDFYCEMSIDDGWADIVNDALEEMFSIVESNGHDKDVLKLLQIKSKFGGLRIYWLLDLEGEEEDVNSLHDLLDEVVSKAEKLCSESCSICSSKEDVINSSKGWVITICKECKNID